MPRIRDAVVASSAVRIYVCNVAAQDGETAGFDLADHIEASAAHTAPGLVDVVLANNHVVSRRHGRLASEPVKLRWPPAGPAAPRLVLDDVVDPGHPHHHDPVRLAVGGPADRGARGIRAPPGRRGPLRLTRPPGS